ncbi:MAG: 16S rRNA (uracil(1498)-N(3))-methyltransferase [Rhizobiaceae bacterium]|jgi:16S rRNA (uracil1498-N3)-methyltransferase|nr:16S rRNA (uracil(1498)-N(3))-methyltransferase [Rhizobiaceae bacterium]
MRANYRLKRLFVADPLLAGTSVMLDPEQAHYLRTVLRMADGGEVLLFNGRDGEWRARLAFTKKSATATPQTLERDQMSPPDLHVLFAPLKAGRLDYLVQKLTEMGAGVIRPVFTRFTQNRNVTRPKLEAWALEAAEQCGILAVPAVADPVTLDDILAAWDGGRRLIFCDEDSRTQNPLDVLAPLPCGGPLAVLIGPEGGFADDERAFLRSLPFVTAIPLGPRILRADTAAVAALAIVQAAIGDWR